MNDGGRFCVHEFHTFIAQTNEHNKMERPPTRRRRLRELVKKRITFGQHCLCGMCKQFVEVTYEVNHIVPFALGGSDHPKNLVTLCKHCHGLYTQNQAIWIERARYLLKTTKSQRLCLGCRKVVSSYFPHTCQGEFTFQQFPWRAPEEAWIDVVDEDWQGH